MVNLWPLIGSGLVMGSLVWLGRRPKASPLDRSNPPVDVQVGDLVTIPTALIPPVQGVPPAALVVLADVTSLQPETFGANVRAYRITEGVAPMQQLVTHALTSNVLLSNVSRSSISRAQTGPVWEPVAGTHSLRT